jgi:hypothetical protein
MRASVDFVKIYAPNYDPLEALTTHNLQALSSRCGIH